jgi:hypothetical protein
MFGASISEATVRSDPQARDPLQHALPFIFTRPDLAGAVRGCSNSGGGGAGGPPGPLGLTIAYEGSYPLPIEFA